MPRTIRRKKNKPVRRQTAAPPAPPAASPPAAGSELPTPKYLSEPNFSVRKAAYWATLDARKLGAPQEYRFLDRVMNDDLGDSINELLKCKDAKGKRSGVAASTRLILAREQALQRESNERIAQTLAACKELEIKAMERASALAVAGIGQQHTKELPTGDDLLDELEKERKANRPVIDGATGRPVTDE